MNQFYGNFGQTFSTTDPSTYPILGRGSRGENVRFLQEKLMSVGYSLPKFGADGDFGGETETAVITFQKANGLTPNGIIGKEAWTILLQGVPAKPVAKPVSITPSVKGGSPMLTSFLERAKKNQKKIIFIGLAVGLGIVGLMLIRKKKPVRAW